ncbi:DNA polymerase subunit gamma-2 isoform X1 [Epargyreus clarus]|uniref:DNA polymerase subunit gamma-2 isoform X1 n=1 Tax=Epargyreus clarus TaxID=520877 RepID=UPI003C2F709C
MRKQIEKILKLQNFFIIKSSSKNNVTYSLNKSSQLVLHNVYKNWLQSIYAKSQQNFPVYLSQKISDLKAKKSNSSYGYIDHCLPKQVNEISIEYDSENFIIRKDSQLKFTLIIPQEDVMQYFIQWQRYRKYWWSSITTTPGLFSVNDVKHEDDNTHANISASFNWGHWTVETVKMSSSKKDSKNSTLLCCSTSLEKSLITLLLDATTNSTKEEYLRLHNKMAPYKISFALSHTEKTHVSSLQELATQIYYKLLSNKISAWLPNFSLPFEPQIKENLQMGATYTAILSEPTLSTGIFHLMNSSTMLKEQVHVADFVNYAALLCGNRI